MMKIIRNILLIIIAVAFISCEGQKPPHVVVNSKTSGFASYFYYDIEVENKGEMPAYFVILVAKALDKDNNLIQQVEKSYGDLFPGEIVSKRLYFEKATSQPKSLDIEFVYQLTMDGSY